MAPCLIIRKFTIPKMYPATFAPKFSSVKVIWKNIKNQSIIQILHTYPICDIYEKPVSERKKHIATCNVLLHFWNWLFAICNLQEYATKRNDSLVNIAQKNSLIRKIATNIQYPYILMNAILGVIPALKDTSTLQNKRPRKKSAHCWLRFSLSKLWVQV